MMRTAFAAALVATLGVAGVARAQLIPDNPESRVEHPLDQGSMEPQPTQHGEPIGHRLALELGVYDGRLASGHFVFALLGDVSARLVLGPIWQLDVVFPFAFSFQEVPVVDGAGVPTGTNAGDGELRTGNPYVAVALVPQLRDWRARFTLGIAGPAAQLSDTLGLDAILAGMEANGGASRWLWMPSVLSLVATADLEHDLGSVVLGGRVAGATSFCTDSSARCGHVFDAPLEAMLFLATKLREDGESRAGLRLRVAAMPTSTTEATQVSLEPYVHFRIERFFVDARFVMNLDDPWGFAFDRRGAWGIFGGVGVID